MTQNSDAIEAIHNEANEILTQLHRHAIQHAVAGSAFKGCAEYHTDEGKILITAELGVTQVVTNMRWQKYTGETPGIGWPTAIRLISNKLKRLCSKIS